MFTLYGMKYVDQLPKEMADGRARWMTFGEYAIVTHPDHRPVRIHASGLVEMLEPTKLPTNK